MGFYQHNYPGEYDQVEDTIFHSVDTVPDKSIDSERSSHCLYPYRCWIEQLNHERVAEVLFEK